ncbi:MAG TPA: SRPBCC domain-containing protein [Chryseolinea sp.]|nr:SRPBCC domain-containing protein [Chryseolinea sp.]
MTKQDFATTLLVDQTPKQVFSAINNPQAWWSGEITGSADKLNDEFTYRYKELHFSKQRIVDMIPDQKVVWLVTESKINYAEDKGEWTDSKISFEISEHDNKTQLRFTHLGLVPEIECFDSCSNSWSQLIQQSLFSLITTGKGKKIFLG